MSDYEYDGDVDEVRNATFYGMTVELYHCQLEYTKEEMVGRWAERERERGAGGH